MTRVGGANGDGSIFRIGTNGTNYQDLLSFTGTAGAASGQVPCGSLILTGTTLYGMTTNGGVSATGNIFSVGLDGSGYRDLCVYHRRCRQRPPWGDLTLSGSTLFGMTSKGGASAVPNGYGTVFALTLPAPTPEPSSLTLIGTAAVALVSHRWRRMLSRQRRSRYRP